MNLAILTQYYPPEVGAPQVRLSELASHFVRRGHSVTVLTAMPSYPMGRIHAGYGGVFRHEQREGVNIIRTFAFPTQSANFIPRLTNYLSFVLSSAAVGIPVLRRPDYLIVESPPLFLGLSGFWLSRCKRSRLIFNVSDLWPDGAVRLGKIRYDSLSFRISAAVEAFCYRHAWLVTGQSKSIIANINERFPDCHTFHLSNGVDTQRFRPANGSLAARRTFGGNGVCVALYSGLHGLAQGLDQVLKIAETLREDEFSFVLVGDGPEKRNLMETAKLRHLTNVQFLEPRPAAEIPALVAAADLSLVMLKTHLPGAVPSKLYEAMASGKPIVLSADGEAAEIVQQHEAGLAVKPGDLDTLTKALRVLKAEPALRRRFGENGRRAAELYFDRAKIAERFIDYLEAEVNHITPNSLP